MSDILLILATIVSGALGAMGMGGGGVLIIYLTLVQGISQHTSQGINLLLFIPCACLALFPYTKKKLIDWRAALPAILCGLAGAALGSWVSSLTDVSLLQKGFGLLLLFIGVKEIFSKPKKPEKTDNS